MAPMADPARPAYAWRHPEPLPRIHEDVLRRAWQADPYVEFDVLDYVMIALTKASPVDLVLGYSIFASASLDRR